MKKRVVLCVFLSLVIMLGGFAAVKGAGSDSGVDSNNDGVVSLTELTNHIQKWINGEVTLNSLTGAIQGWISGGVAVNTGGGAGGSSSTGGDAGSGGSSGDADEVENKSEENISNAGIYLRCSDFSKCGDICCGINEECNNGVCMYSSNFGMYITTLTNEKCVDGDVSEICNNFMDDDGDGKVDYNDNDCQSSIMSTMVLSRRDAYGSGSARGIFFSDNTKYAIINDFCWDGQTRDNQGLPIPAQYRFGSHLIEGRCTGGGQVTYEEILCDGLCIDGGCEDDEKLTCADFGELKFEPISSPWGYITFLNQLPSEIDVSNMSYEEIGKLEGIIKHVAMNSINQKTRGRYVGYIEREDDESYAIEFIVDEDISRDEDCVMGFFEDMIADGGFNFAR